MERCHFSIIINAPRHKVWSTMLDDATYREWTKLFNPTSYYEGEWKTGSKMLFLGVGEDGKIGGMVARIEEVREPEFVSIKHVGLVEDGIEDTTSDKIKDWAGAFENYTFKELENGATEVGVDIDVNQDFKDYMKETWPKALERLKEIAE